MAATTKNLKPPAIKEGTGVKRRYPVKAANEIYIGTFVGFDTSEDALESCPAGAADEFKGIAMERVTGGATDGLVQCDVLTEAEIQLTLASVADANIGDLVYADDNATLTTTATSNTLIGHISGIVVGETNKCWVKLKAPDFPELT